MQAPLFLAGLAIVPIALAALLFARKRPAKYVVRFPAAATLAAVMPKSSKIRRNVPPALLLTALAAMTVALARPEATIAVPVEKASVMLVTDTSGSMNATDVSPTRLAAAQATSFLDKVPDQLQVGLVAFADGPHTVLRPTQDRAQIKSTIAALAADGGTATGDALDSALTALADEKPAAIVLLSDGASKTGTDPAEIAQKARAAKDPDLHRRPRHPRRHRRRRRPVAERPARSGGAQAGRRHLRRQRPTAEDSDALDEVYKTLGSRIGTRKEKKEVSAGFAAIGLLMLGGAAFTTLRWRGRLV